MVWCLQFVVISVVDVCVDCGGVYVFHVCFDLCWCLWYSLGCMFVSCVWVLSSVVVVILVLSVICVVGGALLWHVPGLRLLAGL